jgi:hypothetical protein
MLTGKALIENEVHMRRVTQEALEYIQNCKVGNNLSFRYKQNSKKKKYIDYNGKISKVYSDKLLIKLDSGVIKMISANDIVDNTFMEVI